MIEFRIDRNAVTIFGPTRLIPVLRPDTVMNLRTGTQQTTEIQEVCHALEAGLMDVDILSSTTLVKVWACASVVGPLEKASMVRGWELTRLIMPTGTSMISSLAGTSNP
jgi:hypothetical protein